MSPWPQKIEKSALIAQKLQFNYNLRTFDDDAGRTNTSGGQHAARRPRVRDHCFIAMCFQVNYLGIILVSPAKVNMPLYAVIQSKKNVGPW